MSREIKLRAPVYDRPLHRNGAPYAEGYVPQFRCWVTFGLNDIGINNVDSETVWDMESDKEYDTAYVDFDKARQYIGFGDKHGVDIYEGDILKHRVDMGVSISKPEWVDRLYVVEYSPSGAAFGLKRIDGGRGHSGTLFDHWATLNNEWEVVGNRYQNQEMMRVGDA